MHRTPSLFVSHGTPMFALLPGELGPRLRELGRQLTDVRAVLVVSPHWQTRDVRITASVAPAAIHDFGGFPAALHQLNYAPPGAPEVSAEAARLLAQAGWPVALDSHRGLDHGAWVPLRHLLPEQNVPVLQVSMPCDLDAAGALRLGAALAPLRAQGVLVAGSGSLTHNLYELRRDVRDPQYAIRFAEWVGSAVIAGERDALRDYRQRAPYAERAHPTEEHYLPLLVALGATDSRDVPQHIPGGITDGVLSMDSFLWDAAGG